MPTVPGGGGGGAASLYASANLNIVGSYVVPSYVGTAALAGVVDAPVATIGLAFSSAAIDNGYGYIADGANHQPLLAASSSVTLTLSNLTGPFGTIVFTKVRFFLFWNQSATDSITIGGAASNPWTNGIPSTKTIPAGGVHCFAGPVDPGWTVTASANDQLKILNNSGVNSVPFTLILAGLSSP